MAVGCVVWCEKGQEGGLLMFCGHVLITHPCTCVDHTQNTLYELSLLQGGVVRKETGGEDDAPPEGGGAPDGE